MEVISPFEGFDEGDWISPRISFSQDFRMSDRFSPEKDLRGSSEEEFSFDFCNSVSMDLPPDDSMLSADELFFNGKLRPFQKSSTNHQKTTALMLSDRKSEEENDGFEAQRSLATAGARSFKDNPRCFSMTIENSRGGDGRSSRACMSLSNSRCSSPSRTKSMPRTTPTSPKASSSLPSSSSASTMPSSSFKYSSKFKDFFKLKKPTMGKNAPPSLWPSSSASGEIARECPHSSVSSSCRLPTARSFWPFSRSNSAGESKTAPAVYPPPRRSNSAGEGKTTSSSLLPTNSPPTTVSTKQHNEQAKKGLPSVAYPHFPLKDLPTLTSPTVGLPSPTNPNVCLPSVSKPNLAVKSLRPPVNPNVAKKGLPPLPNTTVKKTSSFLVPAHCGTDALSLSSQSTPSSSTLTSDSSHKTADVAVGSKSISRQSDSMFTSGSFMSSNDPSHVSADAAPVALKENMMLPDVRSPNGDHQPIPNVTPIARKGRGTASPGRPVRRGPNVNPARNFARGSPGRRGVWNSPSRGNGGRVSVRNLERSNVTSKGHVRPKDMLSRDGASVRISPVLNVPVPSLRGTKAASKSKIFSLGNLFSKKEKASRAYTVLSHSESQSGG